MSTSLAFRQWVKAQDNPLSKLVYQAGWMVRHGSLPVVPAIHRPLYKLHCGVASAWSSLITALWTKPLFQSQFEKAPKEMHLYGKGMPYLSGTPKMIIGERCKVSTQTAILGRVTGEHQPELIVGNNVAIGWQTHIAIGTKVHLHNNVYMGGKNVLAGFPGHPMDPDARARGEADTEDQIGDIILEDSVWLGMGVAVTAGVTIGRGTVVATNSVVTKDLPANVLAGGVPARVIRPLFPNESKPELTGNKEEKQ